MTLLLDARENFLPVYFPPGNEGAQLSPLLRPKAQFPTGRSLAQPNTQGDNFYSETFQLGLAKAFRGGDLGGRRGAAGIRRQRGTGRGWAVVQSIGPKLWLYV